MAPESIARLRDTDDAAWRAALERKVGSRPSTRDDGSLLKSSAEGGCRDEDAEVGDFEARQAARNVLFSFAMTSFVSSRSGLMPDEQEALLMTRSTRGRLLFCLSELERFW